MEFSTQPYFKWFVLSHLSDLVYFTWTSQVQSLSDFRFMWCVSVHVFVSICCWFLVSYSWLLCFFQFVYFSWLLRVCAMDILVVIVVCSHALSGCCFMPCIYMSPIWSTLWVLCSENTSLSFCVSSITLGVVHCVCMSVEISWFYCYTIKFQQYYVDNCIIIIVIS